MRDERTAGLAAIVLLAALTACGNGRDFTAAGTVATARSSTSAATTITTLGLTTTVAPTTTTTVVTRGKINAPAAGPIPIESVATGIVTNLAPGQQVWTIVQISNYYPQDGPYPLLPGGGWSGTIFVGAAGDAGKTFIIHVVAAGPTGSAQFADYLKRGKETGSFPGIAITALASDVRFLDSVTVTRV